MAWISRKPLAVLDCTSGWYIPALHDPGNNVLIGHAGLACDVVDKLFYPFITRTYSVDSAQKGLTYT
jgi:hypothetical protein